ncbi:MAG: hypothetical protein KAJ86_00975 [Alphaproteobacteria bacterium]|nr:hypothetical protein [Alphaproteobacteria bacterium]
MRLIIAVLVFGFTNNAIADEFGQRFGNEPPFALRDTLDSTTVFNISNIEPAAGDEEETETSEISEINIENDIKEEQENLVDDSGDDLIDNKVIRIYPEPLKK